MSFFRTHIKPEIQQELFNREKSINFNYDSPENSLDSISDSVQHQFVKSCYARASVVLGKGDVVSLNSNLNQDGTIINEPLNIKNGNPYRGKPGITSITSNVKEFFMKQTTINYYVPDPKEFDEFKDNFLKFGRYMMVEFGWSLPYNFSLPKLDADTILKISKDINQRVIKGKGNYNALVGVVTNYTYNLTNEGAYEGTIEISSMGRNVLGSATKGDTRVDNIVGYVNEKIQEAEKLEDKDLSEKEIDIYKRLRNTFVTFNATMEALKDVVEEYLMNEKAQRFNTNRTTTSISYWSGRETTSDEESNTIYKYKNGAAIFLNKDLIEANDKPCYVTWGWFEDHILNSFFSFSSRDMNENEFRTSIRSVRPNPNYTEAVEGQSLSSIQSRTPYISNFCKTNPNLYTIGYKSIILPGKTKTFENQSSGDRQKFRTELFLTFNKAFNKSFPKFERNFDGKNYGQIRNMVFEVDYLIESFSGITSLDDALTKFWQKVSNDYGGFWRFSVVENENADGQIEIVDLNIGEVNDRDILKENKLSTEDNPNLIYPFKVYSDKSIVSNIELSSENSSEMATLAVYGSNINLNTTSADEGKGYQALSMRALSIIDNISRKGSDEEDTTTSDEKRSQYYDTILDNISNPVFGNFVNSKRSTGTSASSHGIISDLSKTDGIDFDEVEEIMQNESKIHTDLGELISYDTDETPIRQAYFWFKDADDKVLIYDTRTFEMYEEFKRTMLFLINKAPGDVDDDGSSNYSVVPPIVPLQISLSLQGIGGITVGDLFYLDFLPQQFRKYTHFMVVNVNHEITPGGWNTTLESRMIVDIPALIRDKKITQGKRFEPIIVENTLDKKVNEIRKKYRDINEKLKENEANKKQQAKIKLFKQDIEESDIIPNSQKEFWQKYLTGELNGST
jgi:hypothetical protein